MKTITFSLKRATVIVIALCFQTLLFAAPVLNYPITIIQPDGQVINCFVSGDEFYHWLHDENGFTIVKNDSDGYYYYANVQNDTLIPSNIRAGDEDPSLAGIKLGKRNSVKTIADSNILHHISEKTNKSLKSISSKGEFCKIAIFVRFSDEQELSDSILLYHKLYNDSAKDSKSLYAYFKEVSYNKFFVKSFFYPTTNNEKIVTYQDIKPRRYFQKKSATNPDGYSSGEGIERQNEIVYRAVNFIKSQVPDSLNIDSNGDNIVDNLTIIFSGDLDPDWNSILWPSQYNYSGEKITINEKKIYGVEILLQNRLKSVGISSSAHETFHVIGAPDLYHYSFDKYYPVGPWDLMELSSFPSQHMGAYMKFKYGKWLDSIPEIRTEGYYTLEPLGTSPNSSYKIRSPYSTTEFIIVEYRKKCSVFENGLPGEGLLIYRINLTYSGQGNASYSGDNGEVYIFRPGGSKIYTGAIQQANLSDRVGRTLINDNSEIKTFLTSGDPAGIDISNIRELENTIRFYVRFEKSPKASFYSLNTRICNGRFDFINNSSQAIENILWEFGDGSFSNELSPEHFYNLNGSYIVKLTVSNAFGADSCISDTIKVQRPAPPTCNFPDKFCNIGQALLLAENTEPENTFWYDQPFEGTPLFKGLEYNTCLLDSTTIIYCDREFEDASYFAGAKDTLIGNGFTKTTNSNVMFDMFFNCLSDLKIISFKVYSCTAKKRNIIIKNSIGKIVFDSLIYIDEGEQRAYINVDLKAGNNYQLLSSTPLPDFYYNYKEEQKSYYPMKIPGIFELTGNSFLNNYYLYFYDWEIRPAPCSSPRTPVTVEVIKAKISPRPELAICEGNSIVLTSTEASSYLWSPGGETTQSITVQDSGYYSVSTLIGDCENTSLPVNIEFYPKNPQIPVFFAINDFTVWFKATILKGFKYQFDFGDGETMDYELSSLEPNDKTTYKFPHEYKQNGVYTFWQKVTGECGTDSVSYLITISSNAIADNSAVNNLELFPNPTNGIFQFVCPENVAQANSMQIFDFLGRQIITQTKQLLQQGEKVTIDMSKQPAGIYLVRLKTGKEEFSGKVLLVK